MKLKPKIEWLIDRVRVSEGIFVQDFFSQSGKLRQLIVVIFVALIALVGIVNAQTAGTILTLQANYDDGSPVVGTVALTGSKLNQPPALLTSGALSVTGAYSFTLSSGMDASTLYDVTISVPNTATTPPGVKQIYECPFMLLGINSVNLKGMHTVIVFYKTVPASGAFIKTETDSIDKAWQ